MVFCWFTLISVGRVFGCVLSSQAREVNVSEHAQSGLMASPIQQTYSRVKLLTRTVLRYRLVIAEELRLLE